MEDCILEFAVVLVSAAFLSCSMAGLNDHVYLWRISTRTCISGSFALYHPPFHHPSVYQMVVVCQSAENTRAPRAVFANHTPRRKLYSCNLLTQELQYIHQALPDVKGLQPQDTASSSPSRGLGRR